METVHTFSRLTLKSKFNMREIYTRPIFSRSDRSRNYNHSENQMKLCAYVLRNGLVCPSVATHRTCQFCARSEPVNMPKTIESPAKCGVLAVIQFLYFGTSDVECCPQVLSFFITILGRILQPQRRGSWSVFNGKCLITHHHPPGIGSLWFSSLSSYETVVGGLHFGTMSCRTA